MVVKRRSPKTLGDRVRVAREYRKLSRDQLAVMAGIASKTIERLEYNARTDADTKTLLGISDALKVSIDWLLRGGTFDLNGAL